MAGRLSAVHCFMSIWPSRRLSDLEIIREETNGATARKLLRVFWKRWKITQGISDTEERGREVG